MANTFGFGTDTTSFSNTIRDAISKQVIQTLRAGLIALPRGSVVAATRANDKGSNYTLVSTAYPDLDLGNVGALTEGVPPSPIKLGIDTMSFTVEQEGITTVVTDRAVDQSPHDLAKIAPDKIARAVAERIDDLALTALLAHSADEAIPGILSTSAIIRAKAQMSLKNVMPVPGVGYYCVTNPLALAGLENETGLNGYVSVQSELGGSDLSKGVVSQYRGVSFLTSSKIVSEVGSAVTGVTSDYDAAGGALFTSVAHGLVAGQPIVLTAGTGDTAFALDGSVIYYVRATGLTADAFTLATTRGGVGKAGATADLAAGAFKPVFYPAIYLGAQSMTFGDLGTLEYFSVGGPDSSNPLAQYRTFGAKGILGGAILSFAERTDGSGTNDGDVDRVYRQNFYDGS